jgi:ElaB/YqjD/DUF883 family membrane-anchored ribosome-binding protein
MTIVKRLKENFSNFEKSFSNVLFKKVELLGSKTTITVDTYWPRNSSVRQGVNYDFVRFYKGTTKETENMTFGFSFNFAENSPIIVAVHDNNKRYRKELDFETLKMKMKELTKSLNENKENSFLNLTIKIFDAFDLKNGEEKELNSFNLEESIEKAILISNEEQKRMISCQEDLQKVQDKEYEIIKQMNSEIEEAVKNIKALYASKLDPIKEEIQEKKEILENVEIDYVEKLKTTFNNYDMTMEKYLMNLASNMPNPKAIVNSISKILE